VEVVELDVKAWFVLLTGFVVGSVWRGENQNSWRRKVTLSWENLTNNVLLRLFRLFQFAV